ncbi:MAG: ROK family protein [bacterium]|nr:ROK family protein [bacterium]
MTMDAGGTSFVFSAVCGGKALVEPISLPSNGDHLERCLATIFTGFEGVRDQLSDNPAAISFAFPGPADYPAGVIGDLPNLPAFRGGVPLGPMLVDCFGIPVFINNDGDLFALGEAIAGFLPETARSLELAGSKRKVDNLLGVTLGTGFGAGLVSGGRPYLGDNGAGMEIWSTRSHVFPGFISEAGISARSLSRFYAEEAGIPIDQAPDPEQISAILEGFADGDREAALGAYSTFAKALGDSLADAVCLTDSLVVVGGGISRGHRHFLDATVARMNGRLKTGSGDEVQRMEVTAFNLEDQIQRTKFANTRPREISVPGSNRKVVYNAEKIIGVGVSVLGTNTAVALGAYAHALASIDH